MKVICSQPDLSKALSIVSKAVKGGSTLPVLDNILMKTEGKKLYFFATNLEIAIECFIEAQVKNEGSITVPARLLDGYVSLIRDEEVELTVSNATDLLIKTKSGDTKMKGIKSEDFPSIPKVENQGSFVVESELFLSTIAQTIFAASMNASRPVLSGSYFKFEKDSITIVSTDSYRLAEKKISVKKIDTTLQDLIVPFGTMSEILRIFDAKNKDKDIEVIVSKNQILFVQDTIKVTSRLIEGKFPEYGQIIPKKQNSSITLAVADFLVSLKQISLFAKENNYSIKLEIQKNSQKVVISSNATEIGSGVLEVLGTDFAGEDAAIALNAQYLIDFLNTVHEDNIVFHIDTKLTPAIFMPKKSTGYVYLIMPLKLDNV